MSRAFSLVELSIVLVILGLLVGGILAGQSLIRASELRAVTSEYNRYQTAILAFRDKYFAIPGDMANATNFWGTATNCPGSESQGSNIVTCNGNGQNDIGFPATSNEVFRFWQHLSNAGFIEGNYNGVRSCAGSDYCFTSGVNSPPSKLSSGAWNTHTRGVVAAGNAAYYAADYGNILTLGNRSGGSSGGHEWALLTPEEAWNIDTKLDDGKAGTGRVLGIPWAGCGGSSSGTDYTGTYVLSTRSATCALNFIKVY